MTIFVLAILFPAASGLIYKGAMQAGCRRMPLMLAERGITVIGLIVLSGALGGYAWNPDAVWLGVFAGIALVGARLSFLKLLRIGGATVGWVMITLALAVPVLASLTIWGEAPTALQTAGLLLTPVAVILLREHGDRSQAGKGFARTWIATAALVFLFEGLFCCNFKVVEVMELGDSRHLVVLLFNAVAMTTAVGYTGVTRRKPTKQELWWGVLSGVALVGAGITWVNVLLKAPGIVFYPSAAVGSIVIIAVAARFMFADRLTTRQISGVAVAVVAIVMIILGDR